MTFNSEKDFNTVNLILCGTSLQSVWQFTQEEGMKKYYAFYGHKSRILTVIRKLWFQYNFPKKEWWFRKELLGVEGRCIVLDSDATLPFLEWFAQNGKKKKLIFYYWNLYDKNRVYPDSVKKIGYDVWSFDRSDCRKYNMKFNPQLYCPSWYKDIRKDNVCYDISFVGRDKNGRMGQIEELVDRFGRNDYRWNLYFTAHHWYYALSSRKYRRYLSLKEMLAEEMKSRIILDFSLASQDSVTLRTFDALCNDRKLITNIKAIKKEPFYSRDNVFVIDEDPDEEFPDFVQKEFHPIDQEVLVQRNFENWVKVFFGDKMLKEEADQT